MWGKDSLEKTLIFIIVTFSVLEVGLFWINPAYSWDEVAYIDIAHGLYQGYSFGTITGSFTEAIFRPPLLAVTLYLLYLITGFSEIATKLLIPIFTIATTVLIYFFGKKFFNKKLGLIAAAVYATFPGTIFFSYRVLLENYFAFLLIADLFLYFLARDNKKFLIPLGFTLALTALVRYSGILIIPSFLIAAFFTDKKHLKEILTSKYLPLSILIFLLALSPWVQFNFKNYGSPVGAGTTFLSLSRFDAYFGHYFLYWIFIVGVISPFVAYGVWKYRTNSFIFFCSIVLLILILGHDAIELDMRYIVFTLPLFAVVAAYGMQQLERKKFIPIILLLLIFVNVFAGYFVTWSFAYPRESSNLITKIIEIGPNKMRRLDEHISYKEAALELKSASKEDDKVISNACIFVWFYTNRTCYWFGNNTDKNIQFKDLNDPRKISDFIANNQIKWAYVMKGYSDSNLLQNLKIKEIYQNNYVVVYEFTK